VLAQGVQVSAPRDEVHVRSGPGEPGAEVASDTTRTIDSYARHSPTSSALSLPQATPPVAADLSGSARTLRSSPAIADRGQ
jgi:hypothetical protein